ncbi:hypothetical protein JCM11641_001443 [Rhodosporidiobolus odoratus]
MASSSTSNELIAEDKRLSMRLMLPQSGVFAPGDVLQPTIHVKNPDDKLDDVYIRFKGRMQIDAGYRDKDGNVIWDVIKLWKLDVPLIIPGGGGGEKEKGAQSLDGSQYSLQIPWEGLPAPSSLWKRATSDKHKAFQFTTYSLILRAKRRGFLRLDGRFIFSYVPPIRRQAQVCVQLSLTADSTHGLELLRAQTSTPDAFKAKYYLFRKTNTFRANGRPGMKNQEHRLWKGYAEFEGSEGDALVWRGRFDVPWGHHFVGCDRVVEEHHIAVKLESDVFTGPLKRQPFLILPIYLPSL